MDYKQGMVALLSYMRALSQAYQHAHWESSGENFYEDHLLFQRLYESVNDELDKVAEKIIGIFGDGGSLDPLKDAEYTHEYLDQITSIEDFIKSEKQLLETIKGIMSLDGVSDGVQNLLQGIADTHEGHIYLLNQKESKDMSAEDFLVPQKGMLDKIEEEIRYRLDFIKSGDLSEEEVVQNLGDIRECVSDYFKVLEQLKSVPDYVFDKALQFKHLEHQVDRFFEDKKVIASVLPGLVKLANSLDEEGLYSTADEIDVAVAVMAERVGLVVKKTAAKKTKSKSKDEKSPKGAVHKAPKAWFDKMKKDIKKKNPGYSDKRVAEIIGNLWSNELSDAKRVEIYKRHGKKGSPNK